LLKDIDITRIASVETLLDDKHNFFVKAVLYKGKNGLTLQILEDNSHEIMNAVFNAKTIRIRSFKAGNKPNLKETVFQNALNFTI